MNPTNHENTNVLAEIPSGKIIALHPTNPTGLIKYDAACRAIAEAKNVDEVKGVLGAASALRAYASIVNNKQLEIDAAEIRFRAERCLGQMIAAQKETVGLNRGGGDHTTTGLEGNPVGVDERPTLAEAGIGKNLANRAREMADVPSEEFEEIVDDWQRRVKDENERVTVSLLAAAEKHNHRTANSGNNEWYTPSEWVSRACDVMGSIDLDPASSLIANKRVRAGKIFTEANNGLEQEWFGNVWMNPPYSQPLIGQFAEKLVQEMGSGRVESAIVLVNNATETSWFQCMFKHADAVCFPQGRIRFVAPDGALRDSPLQGQAFLYFGNDVSAFKRGFEGVGVVI